MFVSWIAFPAALLVICLGLGLLVDRLAARTVPIVLVAPLGGAGLIVVTQVLTMPPAGATLTVGATLALAAAGFGVGRGRLAELRNVGWAACAAVVVFLVAGLPVIATGAPSFAGYTVLGDTVVHLAGAEELLDRGRDADGLPASNYASTFRSYYVDNAYPAGGATALGSVARLVGADVAWTFQPFLAGLLALLTFAIAGLVEPALGSRRRAALVALIAAQPATLVAFTMQGSLKEIAVAAMLATLAALVPAAAGSDKGPRAAVPLGIAAGACVGALGPSAAIWILPLLAGWVALAYGAGRSPGQLAAAGGVVVLVAVLAASQTLVLLETATSVATSVASTGEVGNLLRPLDLDQSIGVWLTGDFRVAPTGIALFATRVVEAFVLGAAAFGVAWCIARRAWVPLLYAGTLVAGGVVVVLRGSLWADAKALAIVSPALLTLAMLGVCGYADRHRALAVVAGAGIAAGVIASNALIFRSASIAPHDRLEELADIAGDVAGDGPTLFTEFDEFAPYFLRDAQPEAGALLVRSPGDATSTGRGAAADLDAMPPEVLARFGVVITRRGPVGSRPSSDYALRRRTEHYDVWQRRGSTGRVVERVPLGTPRAPLGVVSCARARELAGRARREGGKIVAAAAPVALTANPGRDDQPPGWREDPDDPALTLPSGGGQAETQVVVPAAGRYEVWLEASVGRATRVLVDGEPVGTLRNRLSGRRAAERVGAVTLGEGAHTVTLERRDGGLVPGAGGLFRPLGPVYLVPAGDRELRTVTPARWRELCAGRFDWVEVVA